ncbi:MAG: hypothetical protein ACNA7Y_03825 [Gammaproteobacteria bacterium]
MKNGFILVTLLILLFALSLLSIYAINSSILQAKISHNFFMAAQRVNDADIVLRRAENTVLRFNSWHCKLESSMPDFVLATKNREGLASLRSCRVILSDNREGRYVIQTIQTDTCKKFYRLTAWAEGGVLVQSTYVKLSAPCNSKDSVRLSWRLLS